MNIVEIALSKGFVSALPYIKTADIRPNDNWMGVSVYHPDSRLTKGNKTIIMSLQGIQFPMPDDPPKELLALAYSGSIKYIAFRVDNEIKYETYSGVIPSSEFITSFFE